MLQITTTNCDLFKIQKRRYKILSDWRGGGGELKEHT